MQRLIGILLLSILIFTGCSAAEPADSGDSAAEATYQQITQEQAAEMMEADDSLMILDVRTQEEYDSGHIPGAICVPVETIGDEPPAELPDYGQVILVYCRSGNRSKTASQKLADLGYTNVYEFGGINTWPGEIV